MSNDVFCNFKQVFTHHLQISFYTLILVFPINQNTVHAVHASRDYVFAVYGWQKSQRAPSVGGFNKLV